MQDTGGERTDQGAGARELVGEAQSRSTATFAAKVVIWVLIAVILLGIVAAFVGLLGDALA